MISNYRSPHTIIDHICKVLFTAERRRLQKVIDGFFRSNQEAYGERFDGFHYMGRYYRPAGLVGQLKRKILHFSLHPQMDAHLKDEATIDEHEQQIRQTLFKLLDPCRSEQDIRDALPNCLTDTLGSSAKLPRVQEEAFTIRGDERAMRQYEKCLPTIELYSAARLLY